LSIWWAFRDLKIPRISGPSDFAILVIFDHFEIFEKPILRRATKIVAEKNVKKSVDTFSEKSEFQVFEDPQNPNQVVKKWVWAILIAQQEGEIEHEKSQKRKKTFFSKFDHLCVAKLKCAILGSPEWPCGIGVTLKKH